LFRTPPGYNLLVRGPANYPKDGVAPLEGTVETDWAEATFTVNWKITRPNWKVVFKKGDPICMLLPQRRGELEAVRPELRNIESDAELMQRYRKWMESRVKFVAEMQKAVREKGENAPWQGHYTRGTTVAEEAFAEHQTKLRIREFAEIEPALRRPEPVASEARRVSWWQRLLGRG
jgi:hypothetical protein